MKKAKIGLLAIVCLIATSCGNMNQVLSAIQNGSVINAITSVIGIDKVSAQNLIGSWTYSGPGCAFTSENLLAKAGGEVAAAQIEQKLQPYKLFSKKTNILPSMVTLNESGNIYNLVAYKSVPEVVDVLGLVDSLWDWDYPEYPMDL